MACRALDAILTALDSVPDNASRVRIRTDGTAGNTVAPVVGGALQPNDRIRLEAFATAIPGGSSVRVEYLDNKGNNVRGGVRRRIPLQQVVASSPLPIASQPSDPIATLSEVQSLQADQPGAVMLVMLHQTQQALLESQRINVAMGQVVAGCVDGLAAELRRASTADTTAHTHLLERVFASQAEAHQARVEAMAMAAEAEAAAVQPNNIHELGSVLGEARALVEGVKTGARADVVVPSIVRKLATKDAGAMLQLRKAIQALPADQRSTLATVVVDAAT